LKDGNASGPNGVVVFGAEVWVSDGDSTIKVIDTKTGKITATVATGGTKRANGMALGENIGVVIVANSNDDPPFLSLISTAPDHKILAKIPIPQSGENLERSRIMRQATCSTRPSRYHARTPPRDCWRRAMPKTASS